MCVWGRFFCAKARKICVLTRKDIRFASFFCKTGITLDTCRNFASASEPALKTAQKRQKSDGGRLSCGRRRLKLQREKL